jgi:hypothetical protein
MRSFAWARFALLAGLVLIMGASCSTATRRTVTASADEAPILPHPTLLEGKLGATVCSFNNQPVVLMDSAVLVSTDAEIIISHEQTHARRMREYRGGCWPFLIRYVKDTTFSADEEFIAYCAEGRFAINRNRSPEFAWRRIQDIMRTRYGRTLTAKDNCLYEEGNPITKGEGK